MMTCDLVAVRHGKRNKFCNGANDEIKEKKVQEGRKIVCAFWITSATRIVFAGSCNAMGASLPLLSSSVDWLTEMIDRSVGMEIPRSGAICTFAYPCERCKPKPKQDIVSRRVTRMRTRCCMV